MRAHVRSLVSHLLHLACVTGGVFPSMSGFGVNRNPGFNMNNSMSNNIFNGTGRKHLRRTCTGAHVHVHRTPAHLVGCVFPRRQ